MKRLFCIGIVMCFSLYLAGCGKKAAPPETQEPMSMESLGTMNATSTATPEMKPAVAQPGSPSAAAGEVKLEPLPPAGPYKPSVNEIQTALKNAGYYTGAIDGKSGSMTKKAVESFQKANGLKADGKVGSKTWAALSSYLNPTPPAPAAGTKTKKR